MIYALIPVVLWALGSVCTSRSARLVGAPRANRWRLLIATAVLTVMVVVGHGISLHGGLWGWLLLSGAVGLGLGDLAMLGGYRRIGPRVTILLLLCMAVPVAGITEWIWLGTKIGLLQVFLSGGILAGVSLAVMPGARIPAKDGRSVIIGIAFGTTAAVGQGLGTTLSRVAYRSAAADGIAVDGTVAAWQRMIGGLVATILAELVFKLSTGESPVQRAGDLLAPAGHPRRRYVAWWVVASAFLGPIVGLSVYQWVLMTQPGALVQAVVALTPVVVIPFSWWIDGDRPDWRGVVGGILACSAAIGLALL